jgi:hypothetical protein
VAVPNKRKLAIRTFRLDSVALEKLEKEASRRKVTVNALVNQILLTYTDFELHFSQYPMIRIPSNVFGYALEGVSAEYAKELGTRVARNPARFDILATEGVVNLENLLAHFQLMSDYSNVYSFRHTDRGGRRTVTLYHRWGRKGSTYFGQYLVELFDMIGLRTKLASTEHSVTVEY